MELGRLAIGSLILFSLIAMLVDYNVTNPMVLTSSNIAFVYIRTIITGILLIIPTILYKHTKVLADSVEGSFKEYLESISLFFALLTASVAISVIRPIDLLLFGHTGVYITIGNIKWWIDPWAIAVTHMCLATSFFFYFRYSLMYQLKEPDSTPAKIAYILLIITYILVIHPDNNYSRAYEPVTPIKIASRVMLTIMASLPCVFGGLGVKRRLEYETDPMVRVRLKLLVASNILIALAAVFYMLDALTPQPYSIFAGITYILMWMATTGVGIAILEPEWFKKVASRLTLAECRKVIEMLRKREFIYA